GGSSGPGCPEPGVTSAGRRHRRSSPGRAAWPRDGAPRSYDTGLVLFGGTRLGGVGRGRRSLVGLLPRNLRVTERDERGRVRRQSEGCTDRRVDRQEW